MLQQVWIIPVLATFFAFLAFFVGYGVGIAENHLQAWFSYISDGGALPPESCIFGEFLNLSAMFSAITIYIRHLQIVVFYEKVHHVQGRWRLFDTIMLYLGYLTAFGVTIVANVQETSIPLVHGIGAMIAFITGLVYIWLQTIFAFAMKPRITHRWILAVRFIFVLFTTAGFILYVVVQSARPFVPRDPNGLIPTKPPRINGVIRLWPDSPWYENHLASTVAEWIVGVGLYLFVLSYAFELRLMTAHAPKVVLKSGHKNFNKVYSLMDTTINAYPDNDEVPSVPNGTVKSDKVPDRTAAGTPRNEYYY